MTTSRTGRKGIKTASEAVGTVDATKAVKKEVSGKSTHVSVPSGTPKLLEGEAAVATFGPSIKTKK